MAIRTIKKGTLLKDYKERDAFKEKTGVYPSACQIDYNFLDDKEPCLRIVKEWGARSDAEATHLSLYYISEDVTSHEGMVVGFASETVRVMSDVWEDLLYAIVYEPNGPVGPGVEKITNPELFRRIHIPRCGGTSAEQEYRFALVDASEEIQEIYEYWKQGKRWAKAHTAFAARENKIVREAEAEKRTVRKGKWVEVARGRKVPKGTKGFVFWLQDSRWGIKVGIAIPEKDGSFEKEAREARNGNTYESYKNVAWTYAKNCEVIETPEVVENITKKAA